MTSNAASEPLEPPSAAETTAARVIDTVYAGGVLRPLAPLDLPAGARVRLQLLDIVPPDHPAPAIAVPVPASPSSWRARLGEALDRPLGAGLLAALTRRDVLLLLLGVLVYALTRAIGLTRFPIYFFSDEAIHPLQAEQLLRNGLRDSTGIGVTLGQQFPCHAAQFTVQLGVLAGHQDAAGSRGSPRPRSAMMVRWISLAPPGMVHSQEPMKSSTQAPDSHPLEIGLASTV